MIERRTVRIDEVARRVAMGPFGSNIKTENFVDDGVPVLRGGNLHGMTISLEDLVFVTEAKAEELKNSIAYPGDLVFTHRGTLGQVGIIPKNAYPRYVVSQSQMLLSCDATKVHPKYLFYWFKSPIGQHRLLANQSQTGVPAISRPTTSLKAIELELPAILEQRKIAETLTLLDDKIELNGRMNKKLETMGLALFRDWFVDFGPVKAKMAGTAPYLAPDLWSLFPDRLDDNGFPEGWEMSTIGEQFHLTMGQSPPGSTYNDLGEGLPFFQGRSDFGFRYPSNRKYCTAPTREAREGDTLVSVRAPVGDINMAWEKCCIGRGVAALRHKSDARSFTYYAATSIQKAISAFEDSGTVFGSINRKQFENLEVIKPPAESVGAFERFVSSFDDRIELNSEESRTLVQTRDLLLLKLMSGEIRVGDA